MATILRQTSGSPLIGSPITYAVQAGTYQSPVFHRVKLQVVAGLQGGDYVTMEMSSLASEGETLQFDISSALRAVADSYVYSPDTQQGQEYIDHPYLRYYLVAWDEYIQNSVSQESAKHYYPNNAPASTFGALMGAYSDMERLAAGESKSALRFTRKPQTTPEIVVAGEDFLRPEEMAADSLSIVRGPRTYIYGVAEGAQTLGGANVYALPAGTKDYYQMRFINGLGVTESLCVRSLRKSEVGYNTQQYVIARSETFGTFSRGTVRKQNDYETWTLCSGPLDEAWTQWYAHEFLMARNVWIKVSGRWVPCHILPGDKVEVADRAGASVMEVQFSVRMDVRGSLMSALMV